MSVVWTLLGALVAWPLLGASIGIAAARWKGFPFATGIMVGSALGPMAFFLFFLSAEKVSSSSNVNPMMVVDTRLSSRFVNRRCPECTGPNASLTYQGTIGQQRISRGEGEFVLWGHFVPPGHGEDVFAHRYKCIVCGYEWQFESPHVTPIAL